MLGSEKSKDLKSQHQSAITINSVESEYFELAIFFFYLGFFEKSGIEYQQPHSFVLMVVNLKIISKELLGLSDLSRAQAFYISKPIEIVVVHEYKNFVLKIFKIVLQGYKSFNNMKKFFIVDLVSSLSQNHLFRDISDQI